MSFIPKDIDGVSNNFTTEFAWCIASGAISQMPEWFDREQDGGFYDYGQAFDRIAFRLLKEIRNDRMLKVIRVNDLMSASGQDLLNIASTLGLEFFENYIYDAYKQRALVWAQNVAGGIPKTIKRSLFYYIGSDAFPVSYNPDTGDRIIIEDIYIPSGTAVWGTTAGDTPGDANWGDFNWGDEEALTDENFKVSIYFNNSGSSTDRSTYQYWNLDVNRASLQKIIDQVKAAGMINTLVVLSGTGF